MIPSGAAAATSGRYGSNKQVRAFKMPCHADNKK
jgi:hypothetical protein